MVRGKSIRGGRGRGRDGASSSATQDTAPSHSADQNLAGPSASTPNQPSPSQPSPSQPSRSQPSPIQPSSSQSSPIQPSPSQATPQSPREALGTSDSPQGASTSLELMPSPSTRASGTTLTFGGRPMVYIINNKLIPENTSSEITKIFQKRLYPTGFNWKSAPAEEKEKYFKEFKKIFKWPEADEVSIKNFFMKTAAKWYSDIVSHWKSEWNKNKKKPSCIGEEHWDGWLVYWKLSETIAKSKKNSMNRLTEVEEGKWPAKHTRGSKSSIGHMLEMQKERGGVAPSLYEVQKRTHMHKDGTFIDARS